MFESDNFSLPVDSSSSIYLLIIKQRNFVIIMFYVTVERSMVHWSFSCKVYFLERMSMEIKVITFMLIILAKFI